MDKFEDAFKKISKVNLATHIELWGEPKTEKLYFEAGWQSRQSEFDSMTEALLNQTQLLAKQKVEVEEKDKRIEQLQTKVDAVEHVLGCAMIGPKELFLYAERISKALRGEQ